MKKIENIIHYMDSEDLYDLAQDILSGEIEVDLTMLFPYMDDDDLSKLVDDVVKRGVEIDFVAIAPYLDEKDVYKLVKMSIERKIKLSVKDLLLYMDEDDIDKICQQLVDNPDFDCELSLNDLYPYASEEGIDKLFLHYASQGKYDENALPYVSDKCLHQFVVNYCENPNFDVDIDALYPYLSSKDISLILRTYLKRRKQQN